MRCGTFAVRAARAGVTPAQRCSAAVASACSGAVSREMFAPWLAPAASYQYESRVRWPSSNASAPHGSFWP